MRRLKLRHMEMMLALYEAGSLSEAARLVHVTQPAMSHWLAEMEEIIGSALFLRKRPLVLTPAGEVLLRYAQRMVSDARNLDEELSAVQSGYSARLHIGTILSAAPLLLPRALSRLHRGHPDGQLASVTEAGFTELLERLERRELDVVIGALDLRTQRHDFATEALLKDSVKIVCRPDHPFARKKKPQWHEVAQCQWIMPPAWSMLRNLLENAFVAQGVKAPVSVVETRSSLSILMLLRETDFLCAMRESVADLYHSFGLVDYVRLTPSIDFPEVGIIWSPERTSALLDDFISALRTEAGLFNKRATPKA